jgi:A/G-specific adenine glycosylase
VLVSEVMLQQTTTGRVIERFGRFMAKFPTTFDCAAAPLADLLVEWQGLGYPRRCRNLHLAARTVVDEHGGVVPRDLDALLALPGVGPYTARAVLAFAFGDDAAVVDTNVARVLARLSGDALSARAAQALADDFLPSGHAWEWNQVLMDFGATVCTARSPMCGSCPLEAQCVYRGIGDDPARTSALTSKPQARFEGSDRQARGRLMKRLGEGSVSSADAASVMGVDAQRGERLVSALLAEGLVSRDGSHLTLPTY